MKQLQYIIFQNFVNDSVLENCQNFQLNGSQLAKMKKVFPYMSLPQNL